jgi:hypothetical protein
MVALACLAIAGCAKSPNRVERVLASCQGYGYQPGTPQWDGCIQMEAMLARSDEQLQSAKVQDLSNSMMSYGRHLSAPAPGYYRPY